jgi:hypothetical protein
MALSRAFAGILFVPALAVRPLDTNAMLSMFAGVAFTLAAASECGGFTISIEAFGVSILALAAFLVMANLLRLTSVTKSAARVLIGRVVDAGHNWDTEMLRSFIELFCSLSVVFLSYTSTQRLLASLLGGVLSGSAVIYCGELLTEPCRQLEDALRRSSWGEAERASLAQQKRRIGCSVTVLCLFAWGALRLIFDYTSRILVASTVASLMLFAMHVVSKLLTAWPPTKSFGEVLQDRLLQPAANWAAHPLRSAIELCITVGVTLVAYGAAGQLLLSLQAGVFAGMLSCAAHEAIASKHVRTAVARALCTIAARAMPYALGTAAAFALFKPH